MVEDILGSDLADDVFFAAMASGLVPEKRAEEVVASIEKDADFKWIPFLKGLGGVATGAIGNAYSAAAAVPGVAWKLGLTGVGAGVLGALGYDALKESISGEDPHVKFYEDREAMHVARSREAEDAAWYRRVRRLRDELVRGQHKMPTEEYARKYRELQDALDEKAG